ncbi:MAG: hypothetical protein LBU25_00750, partial [Treponema sp.]|nr:hypothetical protein [Treponema sp.]
MPKQLPAKAGNNPLRRRATMTRLSTQERRTGEPEQCWNVNRRRLAFNLRRCNFNLRRSGGKGRRGQIIGRVSIDERPKVVAEK